MGGCWPLPDLIALLPLQTGGDRVFGPVVAVGVLMLVAVAIGLLFWLIWRSGGRARWPLLIIVTLALAYIFWSLA